MLRGKYWITPDGVHDVTDSEHALFAKRHLLGLPEDDRHYNVRTMFDAQAPNEIVEFRERGVADDVLRYFSKPNEPRIFAIEKYSWIRVRAHRFYLWAFDDPALRMIRNAKAFWKAQPQAEALDAVDIIEFSTHSEFYLLAGELQEKSRRAVDIERRGVKAMNND